MTSAVGSNNTTTVLRTTAATSRSTSVMVEMGDTDTKLTSITNCGCGTEKIVK